MSKSIFETNLKEKFKQKEIDNLSEDAKSSYRIKTLENIFKEFEHKENRFLFYCPDIMVVNALVKTIYDMAYTIKELGYKVVILHEIKGFECKWLTSKYPEYKDIQIEYLIYKRGKKSKKETNQYSFKPTDTLIVPDVFQSVLENLVEIKLIQKLVLITGYSGISNLTPGYKFFDLGVSGLIYLNKKLKEDYSFFQDVQNHYIIHKTLIDSNIFNKENRNQSLPIINISNIGDKEFTNQVINIFYNKYENLKIFSFKFVDRSNLDLYLESIRSSCLFVDLDSISGFNHQLVEALLLNVPVFTYHRREHEGFINDEISSSNLTKDPFIVANEIAEFCSSWLEFPNKFFEKSIEDLKTKYCLEEYYNKDAFKYNIKDIVKDLQNERIKFFAAMKEKFFNV